MSKLQVKGYKVGPKVDQSGLRALYKGIKLSTGQEVFITVMTVRPGRTLDALLRRARLSQKLWLLYIVTAIDYGVSGEDRFYFTHIPTPSFPVQQGLQVIQDESQRQLSLVHYMTQSLEALDYLHQAKTTHRDLYTGQIRVDGKDQVILEGYINPRPKTEGRHLINMVNLPYMSPEQMRGAPADRKADIYSMGVILYELATGELPYESNYAKLEDARQGIIPSPSRVAPSIAPELERVIMKALAPRSARYPYLRPMIDDLQGLRRQQSIWTRVKEFAAQLGGILQVKG
ncbi:MAG: protein kinase [Chlamydiia bacterium]|nr:protein kinase [Chlamydiia bacterium]